MSFADILQTGTMDAFLEYLADTWQIETAVEQPEDLRVRPKTTYRLARR